MPRPLLQLAIAFLLGSALGEDVGRAGAATLLAVSALVLAVVTVHPAGRLTGPGLLAAALGVGAAAAGVEAEAYARQPLGVRLDEGILAEPLRIEGVAWGDGRGTAERYTLVIDADRVELPGRGSLPPGRVRIEIGGAVPRPEVIDGDQLSLFATLSRPRGFLNPGAYDARAAARRAGVVATGYCKSAQLVTVLGPGDVNPIRRATALARRWARGILRRHVMAGPEEGLVRAMVLGDRTGVDAGTAEAFRAAGTFHVLALSGAQVALLAALLVGALRLFGTSPPVVAVVTGLGIGLYAVFVGGDVPVVRAALMAAVVVGGKAMDLDADLPNLLGLAGLVLLAHRPSSAYDVGFQLSFAATLGLLLLTAPLLSLLPRLPLHLHTAIAGSLAAQAALVPLIAAQFHRLTPAAPLLNLLAVPLSSAVLLAGLAVLALAPLPFLAELAGQVAWAAAHALLGSCEPASWLPGLDPRVAAPTTLSLLAYAAGAASLLRTPRRPRTFAFLGLGLLLIAAPRSATGDGRLQLTVLDVGQGDALVLRSPSGRVLVVDAGGSYDGRFDVGEAVVGPYLWSQGITALDGIVATHAHPDHVGGIPALLRGFVVGRVFEGPAPRSDPTYRAFEGALTAAGASRRALVRGMSFRYDGLDVHVRGPVPRGTRPYRARNDDSLVLELALGDVRLLLAGDVEAAGESALQLVATPVVKVPHHGSRSSSSPAFVHALSPRLALVSAGFRNRFGHPHPLVVARYQEAGARVLRTSEEGAITVSTDGRRVWVLSYRRPTPVRLP
jgi:competence protein ComEC